MKIKKVGPNENVLTMYTINAEKVADDICKIRDKYNISSKDLHDLFFAVGLYHLYQLQCREGEFYDFVKKSFPYLIKDFEKLADELGFKK